MYGGTQLSRNTSRTMLILASIGMVNYRQTKYTGGQQVSRTRRPAMPTHRPRTILSPAFARSRQVPLITVRVVTNSAVSSRKRRYPPQLRKSTFADRDQRRILTECGFLGSHADDYQPHQQGSVRIGTYWGELGRYRGEIGDMLRC